MTTKLPKYIWTTPAVIHLVLGADHTPSNELAGTGTLSSPSNDCYRAGADVSATVLSGSASVSGRIVTGETFTPDKVGTYIYVWIVTDQSETRYLKTKYIVSAPKDG